MDYTNIRFSIENGIAHLVLARDDIRNAFSEQDFTDEIVDAMKLTWKRMKIVMEASSAVPLATILKNKDRFAGKRVGVIITGGNVDLDKLPWIKGA